MIGKAKAVGGSVKGMEYLEPERGLDEQKKGYELYKNMLVGETPAEIIRELKDWNADNPNLKNQVFSMVMSPAIEDGKKLSNVELHAMGREFMEKTLGINPDTQPYLMYVHTEKEHKHVHIYTPRTDANGQTINDSFIGKKAQNAADEVAQGHHLTRAGEIGKERIKELKTALKGISVSSLSFDDYRHKAEQKGMKINLTINKQGEMQGYKIQYKGNEYKASDVDRSLTIPKLEKGFEKNREQTKLQELQERARKIKLEQQQSRGRDRGGHSL